MSSQKRTEEMDLAQRLSVLQMETAVTSISKQHTIIKPAIASLEWRIDQFDLLQRSTEFGEYLRSQIFATGSVAWQMHFYPNGHPNAPNPPPGVPHCVIVRAGGQDAPMKSTIRANFYLCVENANRGRIVVAQGGFDFFTYSECILQCPRILQMDGSLFIYLEIRYLLSMDMTIRANQQILTQMNSKPRITPADIPASKQEKQDKKGDEDEAEEQSVDCKSTEDATVEEKPEPDQEADESVNKEALKAKPANQTKFEECTHLSGKPAAQLVDTDYLSDDWEQINTPKRVASTPRRKTQTVALNAYFDPIIGVFQAESDLNNSK